MKTIFITGISSGLGKATAEAFLKQGDCVIGTIRDEKSVQDLKKNFPETLKLIAIDLLDLKQIDALPEKLNQLQIQNLDVLINNAGVAYAAPFEYQNFSDIEQMINLNVLSVMRVTQLLLPYLKSLKTNAKKNSAARIINISSVSGENGTPFLAAYCASKHAIEGFSESLRRELNIYGIKVIIIGPGSVKTPIWDKGITKLANSFDHTVYKNPFHKFMSFAQSEIDHALAPEVVVKMIFKAVNGSSPAVRFAPVPSPFQNWFLNVIPRKLADFLNFKALGLKPPAQS